MMSPLTTNGRLMPGVHARILCSIALLTFASSGFRAFSQCPSGSCNSKTATITASISLGNESMDVTFDGLGAELKSSDRLNKYFEIDKGKEYHVSFNITSEGTAEPCDGAQASVALTSCSLWFFTKRPGQLLWQASSAAGLYPYSNVNWTAAQCSDYKYVSYENTREFHISYYRYTERGVPIDYSDPSIGSMQYNELVMPFTLLGADPPAQGSSIITYHILDTTNPTVVAWDEQVLGERPAIGADGKVDRTVGEWTTEFKKVKETLFTWLNVKDNDGKILPGYNEEPTTSHPPDYHPPGHPLDQMDLIVWTPDSSPKNDPGSGAPQGPGSTSPFTKPEDPSNTSSEQPSVSTNISFGLGRNLKGEARGDFSFAGQLNDPGLLDTSHFSLSDPFGSGGFTEVLNPETKVRRRLTGNGLQTDEKLNNDGSVTIEMKDISPTALGVIATHTLKRLEGTATSDPGLSYTQFINGKTQIWEYYGSVSSGGRTWKEIDPDGKIHFGTDTPLDANNNRTTLREERVKTGNNEVTLSSVATTYHKYPWGEAIISTSSPDGSQGNLVTSYAYYDDGNLKWIVQPDGSWEKHEYSPQTGRLLRTLRPWLNGPTSPDSATLDNCHAVTYQRITENESWDIESINGNVIQRTWNRNWSDQLDPLGRDTRWSSDWRRTDLTGDKLEEFLYGSAWELAQPIVLEASTDGTGVFEAVLGDAHVTISAGTVPYAMSQLYGGHTLQGTSGSAVDIRSKSQPAPFSIRRQIYLQHGSAPSRTLTCDVPSPGSSVSVEVIGDDPTTFGRGPVFTASYTISADNGETADEVATALRDSLLSQDPNENYIHLSLNGSSLTITGPMGEVYDFNVTVDGSSFSVFESTAFAPDITDWEDVVGSYGWVSAPGTGQPTLPSSPLNLNLFNGTFNITMSQRFNADYSLWDGNMTLKDASGLSTPDTELRRTVDAAGRVTSYSYEHGTYDADEGFKWTGSGAALKTIERHYAADPDSLVLLAQDDLVRITETDYQGLVRRETLLHNTSGVDELISETIHDYDPATRQRLSTTTDGVVTYRATQTSPTQLDETDATGVTTRTITTEDGTLVRTTKLGHNGRPNIDSTQDESGLTTTSTTTANDLHRSSSSTRDSAGRTLTSTDEDGLTTSYTYELGGRRTTETLPSGATRITENHLDGQIKSVTGTAVIAEYHSYAVTGEGNIVETIHYGSETSPRWTRTTTNGLGWLLKEERPSPAGGGAILATTHTYNVKGQRVKTETTGIAPTLMVYDEFGRLKIQGMDLNDDNALTTNSTDSLSYTSTCYEMISGSWWEVTTTAQFLGDESAPAFNSALSLRKLGNGPNTIQATLSSDGSQTTTATTCDPATKTVTTYTQSNRATGIASRITVNGLVMSETSIGASNATVYDYDGLERPTLVTDPAGIAHQTVYEDGAGGQARQRVKEEWVRPAGGAFELVRSNTYGSTGAAIGRLVTTTQADNTTLTYDYDLRGNTILQAGSATYPVAYHFDDYGQMDTLTTFRAYTGPGSTGDVTTWQYDEASGALLAKLDSTNHGPIYTYYANGQMKTRTWARGITTTYHYDLAGRLTHGSYSDDLAPFPTRTYYRNGALKTLSDASGLHTYTPAELNNGVAREVIGSAIPGYSAEITETRDTLKRRSALALKVNAQTLTQTGYQYDTATGRLAHVTSGANDWAYGYEATTGRLHEVSLGNVVTSTRSYTEYGQVKEVHHHRGNTGLMGLHYTYDPALHQRRKTATSTVEGRPGWGYDYDDRGQLTGAARTAPTANPELPGAPVTGQAWGYAFDDIGNRLISTRSSASLNQTLTTSYTPNGLNQYDAITRPNAVEVTGVTAPNVPALTVNGQPPTGRPPTNGEVDGFSWWVQGNAQNPDILQWPQVSIAAIKPGAAPGGADATAQSSGRLFVRPSEAPTYDFDGNLISDAGWDYTWDGENRLIAVEQKAAGAPVTMPLMRIENVYDGQSRRVLKRLLIKAGADTLQSPRPTQWKLARTTLFWYDGWNLMAERMITPSAGSASDSDGNITRTYVWGLDLSGTLQGAGGVGGLLVLSVISNTPISNPETRTYAACSDANGNVMGLINTATGTLATRRDYDAFGNTVTDWAAESADLCPFRFSTKYLDAETGWYYYGYRYYSPELGRWPSRDPIGEWGGINPYGMVRNDAVGQFDHLGLYDNLDPYPDVFRPDGSINPGVPAHNGATIKDINAVINALKEIEKVRGTLDKRPCYSISLKRNVSTHEVNVSVGSRTEGADIVYMLAHGGFPTRKGPSTVPDLDLDPAGSRRTLMTSDGYVDVDGTTAVASFRKREFHPYACFVYPNRNRQTAGNETVRQLATDLSKFAKLPLSSCPCMKKLALLVGPDVTRHPGLQPREAPVYPTPWISPPSNQ